jgi:hypothetical protein
LTDALKILITNHSLSDRAGSELYVRDLATALLARGHRPIVYSPVLGEVAREIRSWSIPVVDTLDALATPPDVIHGHHHLETMAAVLHFASAPAVYVCHGWLPWEEAPPRFPRILRYVAVDDTCRDRLVCEEGVPENRVQVLLNFVDLERFAPRPPLPTRPSRGLLFSNDNGPHVDAVRKACASAGLPLDAIGLGPGNASVAPETVLAGYDIVFAKARSALEALAVGAAVVLVGGSGVGPMVTVADLDRLRRLNFGIRSLKRPLTSGRVMAEIERYDPADAAEVSRRIRASAGRDAIVDDLVLLYRSVIDEWGRRPPADSDAEGRAASRYLRSLVPVVKGAVLQRDAVYARVEALQADCERLAEQVGEQQAEKHIEIDRVSAQLSAASAGAQRLASLLADVRADGDRTAVRLAAALDTIANMERSLFWKTRLAWLKFRGRSSG